MGRQTFRDSYAADNRPEDVEAYLAEAFTPRRQARELAEAGSVFLIAEIAAQAAGYARLLDAPAPGFIRARHPLKLERIYVHSAWIGQGVGPALMAACIAEARRRIADGIWLGVWEHNPRALRFYRKWGFTQAGTQSFRLGSERQRDLVLWRPLETAGTNY